MQLSNLLQLPNTHTCRSGVRKNIHNFINKMNESIYENRTIRAQLKSNIQEVDKYKHTNVNSLLPLLSFSNMTKDVCKGVWYNAFEFWHSPDPLHGEGLACPCLSIGKDGAIVPLQYILHNGTCSKVIHINLPQS